MGNFKLPDQVVRDFGAAQRNFEDLQGLFPLASGLLADGAVTTAKIADSAVTDPKRDLGNFYRGYRNSNLAVATTQTPVFMPGVTADSAGITLASDEFTIAEAGYYHGVAHVWIEGGAFAAGYVYPQWQLNTGAGYGLVFDAQSIIEYAGVWTSTIATFFGHLAAGHKLRTVVNNGTNGTVTLEARSYWKLMFQGK